MSAETYEWLNGGNILVGNLAQGYKPWWYSADLDSQNAESVLYQDFVPVDDVLRRLFDFQVVDAPVFVEAPNGEMLAVENRKAMVCSDNNAVLGIFSEGYQGHQYPEWLIQNVANILDSEVGINSAGLLRNRAVAWVSIQVPDTVVTPEGIGFRPNLFATTSFDGTLATTYKRSVTLVVCDNTLAAGLSESGQVFKVKHTRNSGLRIQDAREALAVLHTVEDEFSAEVKRLCEWSVTDQEFHKLMDLTVPVPEGTEPSRGRTMAITKRTELVELWENDPRVSPWRGTAMGALQAYNTYDHHIGIVRGAHRAERNMLNAINGKTADADSQILRQLEMVCGAS